MKKSKSFWIAICFIVAFIVWTVALCFVDRASVGPSNSVVGFANLNQWVHSFTGTNMVLYTITDWLGLVPIAIAMGFGVLGLVQWINRKNLKRVDYDIFVLGGFYIVVMAVYVLFEYVVINYRPIFINECLEASYPSSTTMLVTCVMPTAIMQLSRRIKNKALRNILCLSITAFIIFMVVGRLLSGVHWITDIIGGGLISTGLVLTYRFVAYKS